MKRIVISIHPEHVTNILNGTKKYEYRKIVAKYNIDKLLIYETMPIKKVVAEVDILEVLILPPEELWIKTNSEAGISKKYFDKYFYKKQIAYAYKLGNVKIYDQPKELVDFGIKSAPQSFVYIN